VLVPELAWAQLIAAVSNVAATMMAAGGKAAEAAQWRAQRQHWRLRQQRSRSGSRAVAERSRSIVCSCDWQTPACKPQGFPRGERHASTRQKSTEALRLRGKDSPSQAKQLQRLRSPRLSWCSGVRHAAQAVTSPWQQLQAKGSQRGTASQQPAASLRSSGVRACLPGCFPSPLTLPGHPPCPHHLSPRPCCPVVLFRRRRCSLS